MKTIRTYAFISLLVVAILYQLANIAYFAAGGFCSQSEIAGKCLLCINSFEDGASTLDANSSQLVLSKGLWLERCRQRPQFPDRAERIWQSACRAPRPITRDS